MPLRGSGLRLPQHPVLGIVHITTEMFSLEIGDRIVPSFFSKNGWKEYKTLKDDWHNPDFALHWDRTDLEGNPVRAGQLDLPFFFSGDGCVPMPRFWIWASDPERWKRGCFAFGQTSGWWAWMRPRPCSAWRNSG